jgi:pimeloyl-ACP methyl ester carboxylesterase
VHGTWHGGWVWQDVANRLRTAGHRVYTPTCTGCGERLHLTGPEVGLNTHITDIAQVLEFEDLNQVILVGHSFSGITITGVADRCRERIDRIVFFDALVPREGRMSGVPKDPETGDFPDWWKAREQHFIDGYQMDLWQDYPMEMLVPDSYPEIAAKLKRLITPHPAKQWTDELVLERGGWDGLNPTYIHCVGQTYRKSSDLMVGPARGPDWTFIELDIPRDGMLTHSELVSTTLSGLVG